MSCVFGFGKKERTKYLPPDIVANSQAIRQQSKIVQLWVMRLNDLTGPLVIDERYPHGRDQQGRRGGNRGER